MRRAVSGLLVATGVFLLGMGTGSAETGHSGVTGVAGGYAGTTDKIEALVSRGVIVGYPDGTFRPDESVTRGTFSAFVARAFDLRETTEGKTYRDVTNRVATHEEIDRVTRAGILQGYADGMFRPNEKINRREMVTIIERVLEVDKEYPLRKETAYKDLTNKPYKKSVEKLTYYGVLPNYGDEFHANRDVSRVEAVEALYGVLEVRGLLTDYLDFTLDDYFEAVEWIDRGTITSLSLYPKEILTTGTLGENRENHIANSFRLVKELMEKDTRWQNTASLSAQYTCHAWFAGNKKVPWNIEPHRTETDLGKVILASCNP